MAKRQSGDCLDYGAVITFDVFAGSCDALSGAYSSDVAVVSGVVFKRLKK